MWMANIKFYLIFGHKQLAQTIITRKEITQMATSFPNFFGACNIFFN
jgi:hypothetical protein